MFQRAITFGLLAAFILMAMPVTSQTPAVASITIDWDYTDQDYRVTFTEAVSASDVAVLVTDITANVSENITDGNGLITESSTTYLAQTSLRAIEGHTISVEVFHQGGSLSSRNIDVIRFGQPELDYDVTYNMLLNTTELFDNGGGDFDNTFIEFTGRGFQIKELGANHSNFRGVGNLYNEEQVGNTNSVTDVDLTEFWVNTTEVNYEVIEELQHYDGIGFLNELTSDTDSYELFTMNIVEFTGDSVDTPTARFNNVTLGGNGQLYFQENKTDGRTIQVININDFGTEVHSMDGWDQTSYFTFDGDGWMNDWEDDGTNNDTIWLTISEFSFLEDKIQNTTVDEYSLIVANGSIHSSSNDGTASQTLDFDLDTLILETVDFNTTREAFFGNGTLEFSDGVVTEEYDLYIGQRIVNPNTRQVNWNNDEYDVIVVESVFNANDTRSIAQGGGQDYQNTTYLYNTRDTRYDNPTIYYTYSESVGDPPVTDSGEEYPEDSPIWNPDPPNQQTPEGVGISEVTEMNGTAPSILEVGDVIRLNSTYGVVQEFVATTESSFFQYNQTYVTMELDGTILQGASGTSVLEIIMSGNIPGLIYEFDTAYTWQNQTMSNDIILEGIVRPSQVSELDNSAPDIVNTRLVPPYLPNDGSSAAVIEVEVRDVDLNVERVWADLSALGGEAMVDLYDDGTHGDAVIRDGNWSLEMTATQQDFGDYPVPLTAVDFWNAVDIETMTLTISNAPPIFGDIWVTPTVPNDGTTMATVTAEVSDIDAVATVVLDGTSLSGGQQIPMTSNSNGTYTGSIAFPTDTAPGQITLRIIATDAGTGQPATATLDVLFGVNNVGPVFEVVSIDQDTIKADGFTKVLLEVEVEDGNGISLVYADMQPVRLSALESLYDDGTHGDKVANDGIYSLEFIAETNVRPSTVVITITAVDIYGAENTSTLEVVIEEADGLGISNFALILGGFGVLVVALIVVGVALMIRKSSGFITLDDELDEHDGLDDLI